MLRRHKRLVGVFTFLPYAWLALQLVPVILFVLSIGGLGRPERAFGLGLGLVGLGVVTLLVISVLWVWFLVDASFSPQVPERDRVLWILLLLLGTVLAMPFYWYLQIWRVAPFFAGPVTQAC